MTPAHILALTKAARARGIHYSELIDIYIAEGLERDACECADIAAGWPIDCPMHDAPTGRVDSQ